MKKCLAFVLGGGGSRGALQVGALRALFEADFQPDLLVGTWIGAVNSLIGDKMSIRKTPLKIRFLILWFLLVLPLLVYLTYTISNDETAKILNLSVGYMRNNQIALSQVIPAGANRLFVCGKIVTHGSNYLAITLHSVDEKEYYGKEDSNESFSPGDFCSEIMLHGSLAPGFYKIIVIDNHKRVGELIFQVK